MKSIKMLGIVVAAAVAVMAFVGVGTASAAQTGLCKDNLCLKLWPAETEFTAKSTSVRVNTGVTVTCESTMTFKADKQSGEPLSWSANSLTWSNCTGCKTPVTTVQPSGTVAATGSGNGTLKTSWEAEMKGCPLGITCKIKATNGSLTVSGGASGAATLTGVNVPITGPGGLCGASGTFNAGGEGTNSYTVVTAKEPGKEPISNPSVYVRLVSGANSSTILCSENSSPCPLASQIPPLGMEIKAESPKIVFSGGPLSPYSCEPSTIVFKINEEPGKEGEPLNGKVTEMTWKNCGACQSHATTKLPSFSLSAVGVGNGTLPTTSVTEIERENCGFTGKHCPMTISKGASLSFVGGAINSTAKVSATVPVSVGGEPSCIKFTTWNANGELGSQPYVIKSVNGVTTGSIFVE